MSAYGLSLQHANCKAAQLLTSFRNRLKLISMIAPLLHYCQTPGDFSSELNKQIPPLIVVQCLFINCSYKLNAMSWGVCSIIAVNGYDFLNDVLREIPDTQFDIATAFFNIQAYAFIKENIQGIKSFRLLLGKAPEIKSETTLGDVLLRLRLRH